VGLNMDMLGKFSHLIAQQTLRLVRDEPGATSIEYAMVASGIAVVIAAAVAALGLMTRGMYDSVVNLIK